MTTELENLRSKHSYLAERYGDTMNTLSRSQLDLKWMQEECKRLQETNDEMRCTLDVTIKERDELRCTIEALTKESAGLRERHEDMQRILKGSYNDCDDAREQLRVERKERHSTARNLERLFRLIDHLELSR